MVALSTLKDLPKTKHHRCACMCRNLEFVVSNTARARVVNLEMLTLNKDLFAQDGNREDVRYRAVVSWSTAFRSLGEPPFLECFKQICSHKLQQTHAKPLCVSKMCINNELNNSNAAYYFIYWLIFGGVFYFGESLCFLTNSLQELYWCGQFKVMERQPE